MTYDIIAQDNATPENTLCIQLWVINNDICEDIMTAIKNACREFIATPAGKNIFEHYRKTYKNFSWRILINEVPEAICEKHGFRISRCRRVDKIIDINEQLY